jgi:type II secretory pathway pseudopilin PulG
MRTEARKSEIRNSKFEIPLVVGRRVGIGTGGFSLIEIVLVTLVIGILAGMLIPLLQQGMQGYAAIETRADLTSQAREATDRMVREMRNIQRKANNAPNISSADGTSITFVDAWTNTITFDLSGSKVQRNADILVDQVSGLQLRYFDGSNTELISPLSGADLDNVRRILLVLTLAEGGQTLSVTGQAFVRDLTGQ